MTDLSGGYFEGVDYLKLVFNSLSPAHLKLSLNLSGHPGPDLTGRFTYAELGAGFGISIAGWAAQYPQATFHAIDYNRNHTAWTEELAAKAGLGNLHVHGLSIDEALGLELPKFDFIVAHGLYSWVSDEVRAECRTFIRTLLKPGGCVYLSYNAMPGFKDFEPMRHLILHEARNCVSGDPMDGLKAGLRLLENLMESGASYFEKTPQAKARLNEWLAGNPKYLAAELLTGSHRAYHFSDLVRELDGLRWAGWANMVGYLAAQIPPAGLEDLLAKKDPLTAETIRDLFYNTIFRTDIFVNAATANIPEQPNQSECAEILDTSFSLGMLRKPLPPSASRQNFDANLSDPIYQLLQSALAAGPLTLARLSEVLQIPVPKILRSLCVLMALDWVHAGPPSHAAGHQSERVIRFNNALSDLYEEDMLTPVLSAHGGWLKPEDQLEHLTILARLKGEPVEDSLCRTLRSNEPESSPSEEAALRQSIRQYLSHADKSISLFLRRHGLTC